MTASDAKEFPVEMVLNLHSTHADSLEESLGPFHFEHTAAKLSSAVVRREDRWIRALRSASALAARGPRLKSSQTIGASTIELYNFERFTMDATYNVTVNAMTFEGNYIDVTDVDYIKLGNDFGVSF